VGTPDGWQASTQEGGGISISYKDESQGTLSWELMGDHNRMNALAALSAARHAGVPVRTGIESLARFKNVKRRMEVRGIVRGITVYDDFAHHPTAIHTTLQGLRDKVKGGRIVAVLEPRSNTMKMGTWKENLAGSLITADRVFCYTANLGWNAAESLQSLGSKISNHDSLEQLIAAIVETTYSGDHVLIMSNGGFGGIHEKLLKALAVA
jgi:UDP-N-acetylmuramate: L-alanyl-gamma-D-glutamyl-meso-diaminopimelate ligase